MMSRGAIDRRQHSGQGRRNDIAILADPEQSLLIPTKADFDIGYGRRISTMTNSMLAIIDHLQAEAKLAVQTIDEGGNRPVATPASDMFRIAHPNRGGQALLRLL